MTEKAFKLTVNYGQIKHPDSYDVQTASSHTLFQAKQELQEKDVGFSFTYKNYPELGPFLVSVNGVAGSEEDHTYWKLRSRMTPGGPITDLEVGMGQYIPKENEEIILQFSKY